MGDPVVVIAKPAGPLTTVIGRRSAGPLSWLWDGQRCIPATPAGPTDTWLAAGAQHCRSTGPRRWRRSGRCDPRSARTANAALHTQAGSRQESNRTVLSQQLRRRAVCFTRPGEQPDRRGDSGRPVALPETKYQAMPPLPPVAPPIGPNSRIRLGRAPTMCGSTPSTTPSTADDRPIR